VRGAGDVPNDNQIFRVEMEKASPPEADSWVGTRPYWQAAESKKEAQQLIGADGAGWPSQH
jgi:hypothetical protein